MNKSKPISIIFSLFLLISFAFNAVPAIAADNTWEIKQDKQYIIYSRFSNKCLESINFNTANGTKIRQWDYWGNEAQTWKLEPSYDGYYYIINSKSGKALEIGAYSKENGTSAEIYDLNYGANQQWKLESTGDGYFYIKNRISDKVLDIEGYSKNNGALCIQYNKKNAQNQQFKLAEADNTYNSESNDLTYDFNNLFQQEIVSQMGAGWNLGNQLDASINGVPGETVWGNPIINKSLIKSVKNQGFKTIRIPVTYLSKIGNAPDYTIDSNWLSRVQEVVDYAYSEGLYIIINIHGDGYNAVNGGWLLCNGNNQNSIKDKYEKVWRQIAYKFKDYDEHLIFESINEEFNNTYSDPDYNQYQNINDYNQIFVDTIRKTGGNNSARWLLIPGWNTNINYTAGNYGFRLPTDYNRSKTIKANEQRIMISAHYYEPWDFCGNDSSYTTVWGSASDEQNLDMQFKKMHDAFVSKGYPVVIGEFGAIDKSNKDWSNNYYRAKFVNRVCLTARKYNCVPIVWDNGHNGENGFGLFERTTGNVTQRPIIDAIKKGMSNKYV